MKTLLIPLLLASFTLSRAATVTNLPHVRPANRAHVTGHHEAKTVDPAKIEAASAIYKDWAKSAGGKPMTGEVMKKLYQTAGFEGVKTLIERSVIPAEHSMQMADHRILFMLQTFEAIVKQYQSEGRKIRIHRSDSGNQKAGMGSDVDQTIFVEEFKDGKWLRTEALDNSVADLFRKKFTEMHGLTVEALDIATIAGKDKFPDWRTTRIQTDAEGKRPFKLHAAETLAGLERTPGAYQECGPVVQQVQLRSADKLETDLREGRATEAPPDPREMLGALKEYNPDFRLNHLVLLTIGAGDDPNDKTIKAREAFQEDAVRVMFDGLKPQLIAGHGYDAAVANYIEFSHHLHDKNPAVKYHLRALDDGLNTIRRLRPGSDSPLARVEYAKIPEGVQRKQYLELLFGKDLAAKSWDGTSFLDRWQTSFDISAKLRDLHSAKKLTDETAAETFHQLATDIAAKEGKPTESWREYLPKARAEYNQRCQEFFMYNIVETSHQRVAEWLSGDPNDPKKRAVFEAALDEAAVRKQMKLSNKVFDHTWNIRKEEILRNFSEMAHLELMSTFRKINDRPDLVKLIIENAQRKGLAAEDVARLKMIAWESAGIFHGKMEYKQMPEMYLRYYAAQVRQNLKSPREYGLMAMERLGRDYGFIDSPEGPRATKWLKQLGMHGLHTKITEGMKTYKLAGITDRFLGNNVLNLGGLQSASTVLRVYSESGGDPDETIDALITEAWGILPGIGQIKGAHDAGLDPQAQFLFVAAMTVPAAGIVVCVYTIGENGVVLYEHEISGPLLNEQADAIYRGYVGPSLYGFSRETPPPGFDTLDIEALKKARADIKELTSKVQGGGTIEDAKALARTCRAERQLSAKKAAWKAYEAEEFRWRGSAILGSGQHLKQQRLELPAPADPVFAGSPIGQPGPLLGRIKPIIFHARGNEGPVDFTIKELTGAEKSQLAQLEKELAGLLPPHDYADRKHEFLRLKRQQKSYERAQRYLAEAAKNHELMHQIQRDSLYPNLLRDDPEHFGMVVAADYVAKWVSVRRDVLTNALAQASVSDKFMPWSREVLDALAERLQEDTERSKRLWLAYEQLEKAKAKAEKDAVEREKGALAAEVLADAGERKPVMLADDTQAAIRDDGGDVGAANSLQPIAGAYLARHIPESAPRVRISMRRVPTTDDDAKSRYDFRPDVAVEANPAIYQPPYFFVLYVLDPLAAKAAIGARAFHGLPLDDATVSALQKHLEKNPVPPGFDLKKDSFTPAVVTFVFCDKVEIPQRVIKETVEDLPVLKEFTIPVFPGMKPLPEGRTKGFLFGSGAAGPATEVVAVEGPLHITSQRADTMYLGARIFVKCDAVGKLATNTPDQGIYLTLERSLSASGPWTNVEAQRWLGLEKGGTRDDDGRFVFFDSINAEYSKGTIPYQPVHYRVSQQGFVRAPNSGDWTKDRRLDKPVYSNVISPIAPFLRLSITRPPKPAPVIPPGTSTGRGIFAGKMRPVYVDWGTDNVMYVNEGPGLQWITMGAELIMANQYYTYYDAHFTVTAGDFTGHFYGPPCPHPEDPKRQRYDSDSLRLPWSRSLNSFTVQADAPGGSASRTITVTFATNITANIEKRLADLHRSDAKTAEDRQKSIATMQKRIEEADAKVAEKAKHLKQSYGPAEWAAAVESLEEARLTLERTTKCDWPTQDTLQQTDAARTAGDHKRLLQIAQSKLALRKLELDYQLRGYTITETRYQRQMDSARQNKEDTKHYEDKLKELAQYREEAQTKFKNHESGLYEDILRAAAPAGDAAAYRQSLEFITGRLREKNQLGLLGGWYCQAAPFIVMLTGSRDEGKKLLTEGKQLLIQAETDPQRKQYLQRSWENDSKPAWWPR